MHNSKPRRNDLSTSTCNCLFLGRDRPSSDKSAGVALYRRKHRHRSDAIEALSYVVGSCYQKQRELTDTWLQGLPPAQILIPSSTKRPQRFLLLVLIPSDFKHCNRETAGGAGGGDKSTHHIHETMDLASLQSRIGRNAEFFSASKMTAATRVFRTGIYLLSLRGAGTVLVGMFRGGGYCALFPRRTGLREYLRVPTPPGKVRRRRLADEQYEHTKQIISVRPEIACFCRNRGVAC